MRYLALFFMVFASFVLKAQDEKYVLTEKLHTDLEILNDYMPLEYKDKWGNMLNHTLFYVWVKDTLVGYFFPSDPNATQDEINTFVQVNYRTEFEDSLSVFSQMQKEEMVGGFTQRKVGRKKYEYFIFLNLTRDVSYELLTLVMVHEMEHMEFAKKNSGKLMGRFKFNTLSEVQAQLAVLEVLEKEFTQKEKEEYLSLKEVAVRFTNKWRNPNEYRLYREDLNDFERCLKYSHPIFEELNLSMLIELDSLKDWPNTKKAQMAAKILKRYMNFKPGIRYQV